MAQVYADVAALLEDDRIRLIGEATLKLAPGRMSAFLVEDEKTEPGKADRYVEKLTKAFPTLEVVDRFPHPVVANVTCVRVRRQPDVN